MNTLPQANPVVHLGVDVAKSELVIDLDGLVRTFANHSKGIAALLKAAVRTAPSIHLVCEATAGYERPLADAAVLAGIPVSIVQPQRVRSFARSLGRLAKSDPIDAAMLSRFGTQARPAGLQPKDAIRQQLDELVRARAELIDALHRQTSRAEHHTLPVLARIHRNLVDRHEKHIAAIDKEMARLIASSDELRHADQLLRAVAGVGDQTSRVLHAHLPELGRVGRREIAALAGLAPYDRDSGKTKGKRYIQGGRERVRKALYMAAFVGSRCNPVLNTFYRRLKDAGKPFKVAIIAVARKLLIHLNSIMEKFYQNPVAA